MKIIESITRAGYVATEHQVEDLARDVQSGKRADGTYLRVLVVAVQASIAAPERGRITPKLAAALLKEQHERFYPAVLRGVGDDTMIPAERNRRATFARTAASTLRSFIKAKGDVRSLKPEVVTKTWLRHAVSPPVQAGNRLERTIATSEARIERSILRMAARDPDSAHAALERIIGQLTAQLEDLPSEGKPQVKAKRRRNSRPNRKLPLRPRQQPVMHQPGMVPQPQYA